MIIAIHQPIFFPWLGFFHKLSQVDQFYIFDHVQASGGKSWFSRNRILFNNEPRWLTAPVQRNGLQLIKDVKLNKQPSFTKKHLGTLKQAYCKAPFFKDVFTMIEDIYEQDFIFLSEFNTYAIKKIASKLELNTSFIFTSELAKSNPCLYDLRGNDLVLEICSISKCSDYLSGSGCLDFINPQSFLDAGINFHFQEFTHPVYKQGYSKEFISHLSIIDALMNLGFSGVRTLLDEQK